MEQVKNLNDKRVCDQSKDGKVIKPDTWEDPAPKIRACIDAVIARKGK